MYARVWRFGILPGKVAEFTVALNSFMPVIRQQPGFRGCVALHSGPGEALESTVVSMWSSIDTLRNSETETYQQALVQIVALCERHPVMREEEVLLSEFVTEDPDDTVTKF